MRDANKTKAQLIEELKDLRARVQNFERTELEHKQKQEIEHRHRIELETLRQASLSLTASLDLEDIFHLILEYTLQLVEATDAHLFTYDDERLAFGAALWQGGQRTEPFALPRQDGLTYWVARSGKPLVVSDMSTHDLFRNQDWEGAIVGLPLKVDEQVRGVMNVAFDKPCAFETGELHLLNLLAEQAAIAIQNAQYVTQIETEIAERKRAEEELQKSEERHRGLSGAAFEAIFLSEKGICLEQNPTAEHMFGYTLDEAVGRYGTEWIVPEDREMVMQHMLAGYEEPYEATALRKDGTTFPAEIRGKMMHYKGRAVRVTALHDISPRKQAEAALQASEAKFRMLAEQSPNMIFINQLGRVVYVNALCEELLGYRRDEFYTPDFDYLDLVAPEHHALVRSSFARHMRGEDIEPYEYSLVTKSGERIEVIITTRLIDYEGKAAILGIVTNITERSRVEQALRVSYAHLEALMTNTTDCILITDINGHPVVFNAAYQHHMQTLYGGSLAEFTPIVFRPRKLRCASRVDWSNW